MSTTRDKIKKPMGMINLLIFVGGDSIVNNGDFQFFLFFPVGVRDQFSFPMEINFHGIFLNQRQFLADFSSGWGDEKK